MLAASQRHCVCHWGAENLRETSCAVVFVPVFFAGIVFAATFRDSRQPDVDFGSNIAGAIVGGLTETLSLVVGFNALLGVAMVFYGLSWALGRRAAAAAPAFAG